MEHLVRILHMGFVTHDVKQFIVTCPEGFDFEPGQGVELAVDQKGWVEEGRPFTPTSPRGTPVLEFIIKVYPEHDGVTRKLHAAAPGDALRMSEPFGTIAYQGPGVFLAGGAGLTPFLGILRQIGDRGELDRCSLLFSNRTPADVIAERELRHLLGDRCHLTCTREAGPGYDSRRMDRAYLEEIIDDIEQPFYVCGPPGFVAGVRDALETMGADPARIVLEE